MLNQDVFNGHIMIKMDLVLSDCHINNAQAQCQGKNQQWKINTIDQSIVSQMNGKW
jgi:hypothetical protein